MLFIGGIALLQSAARRRIASSSVIVQTLPCMVIHRFSRNSRKVLEIVSRVVPIDWPISS